jgi:3-dehydroquinate dehydratase / shikimate dehydrogenase
MSRNKSKGYDRMKKSNICLAVTEPTLKDNIDKVRKYNKYIDMVELRADFLDKDELQYMERFPDMTDLPVILTIRKKEDGGHYTGDENQRCALLDKGASGNFRFVDLEEDLRHHDITLRIKNKGKTVIRSFHDFNGIPDNLARRMKDLAGPGEIPKAAVMPRSTKDLIRLLECYAECEGMKKILLGMGSFGFPTRICASLLGSFLTFCSVPQMSAAPGHVDPVTIKELYRVKLITKDTLLYGIIGNPVMHTLSPVIHNRGFIDLDLDAVYLPFHVDSVMDFMHVTDILSIRGFSVTIPHKEEIIQYLSHHDESVTRIGACNTVVRRDPGWYGLNSDGRGFLEPLKKRLDKTPLDNLRGTVIGAGGAAKAVISTLAAEGVDLLILNRTVEKAEHCAARYHCAWGGLDADGFDRMESYSDIIVQTTNVGMEPDIHRDPVPGYQFKGHEIAYDIVYKPQMTHFLTRAHKAGCPVILGKEMLLHQAFVQFRLFTGKEYPDKEGIYDLV